MWGEVVFANYCVKLDITNLMHSRILNIDGCLTGSEADIMAQYAFTLTIIRH